MPRLLAAALVAGAALGLVGPGPAAAADGPVGGPLLGLPGTVVQVEPGGPALPRGLSATGWLVADLDTGEVLAARNAHRRFAPASTLKTLTAETLIPRLAPRRVVVPTAADVRVDGSRVGLVPGLGVRVDQLFTALLVVSGNDAANALGRAAGGTGAAVALLNAEARRLQAGDTLAKSLHGLDAPGQTSSPYDLALIARAGMAQPDFRRYVATVNARMPGPHGKSFQIYTHNRLLTHYPGALGIKNGYTSRARASFVGAARRGGHTLVVTLLHAPTTVWRQAGELLDWGFAALGRVQSVGRLVEPESTAPRVSVSGRALAGTAGQPGSGHEVRPAEGVGLVPVAAGSLLALGGLVIVQRRRVVRRRRARRMARRTARRNARLRELTPR